jgi:hypothetical protein
MKVKTYLGSLFEHKIRLLHHSFFASCKPLLEADWVSKIGGDKAG